MIVVVVIWDGLVASLALFVFQEYFRSIWSNILLWVFFDFMSDFQMSLFVS